jgi:hypothetical protein
MYSILVKRASNVWTGVAGLIMVRAAVPSINHKGWVPGDY